MILPAPHYQQAHPHSCIPACVRMILAYYGQEYDEETLAQAFNTIPYGRAGIHAVVIIGIENNAVVCLDPTVTETLHMSKSSFVSLWSNLGRQGMAIWK